MNENRVVRNTIDCYFGGSFRVIEDLFHLNFGCKIVADAKAYLSCGGVMLCKMNLWIRKDIKIYSLTQLFVKQLLLKYICIKKR